MDNEHQTDGQAVNMTFSLPTIVGRGIKYIHATLTQL